MVTPDRLYVWKDAGSEPVEAMPTYVANLEQEFAPYYKSARIDPQHVSGAAFQLLAGAWLSDLTRREIEDGAMGRDWLNESGFQSVALDGLVDYETVV